VPDKSSFSPLSKGRGKRGWINFEKLSTIPRFWVMISLERGVRGVLL
jgi:hypothetical protein